MRAVTKWKELKGKTIVDVLDEGILVFSDETFACVDTDEDLGRIVLLKEEDLGNYLKLEFGLITQEQYDLIRKDEIYKFQEWQKANKRRRKIFEAQQEECRRLGDLS